MAQNRASANARQAMMPGAYLDDAEELETLSPVLLSSREEDASRNAVVTRPDAAPRPDDLTEEELLGLLLKKRREKQKQPQTASKSNETNIGLPPAYQRKDSRGTASPGVTRPSATSTTVSGPSVLANVEGFKSKKVKYGRGTFSAVGSHQIFVAQRPGDSAPDLSGLAGPSTAPNAPSVMDGAKNVEFEEDEFEAAVAAAVGGAQIFIE